MINEELFNILERLQVGDQALLNAHDEVLDLIFVMQRDMLNDMIMQQEEIVSSPIRFNGVHIEKIKKIFKNNGTEYQPPF
jgi:hypothetical protein